VKYSPARTFALLVAEPFWLTPDVIALLTDWQVSELYFKPAIRRARDAQKKRRIGRVDAPDPKEGIPISREAYVRNGLRMFGGTADHWGKKWDAAKIEFDAYVAAQKGTSEPEVST
jgi:hypothetical protein